MHLGFDPRRSQQPSSPTAARSSLPVISASTATASGIDHGLGVQSLYGHLSSRRQGLMWVTENRS